MMLIEARRIPSHFAPGRVPAYWDETESFIREGMKAIFDASGVEAYRLMRDAFLRFEALAAQLAREQGIERPKANMAGQMWRRALMDQSAPIWQRLHQQLAASALRYAVAAYIFEYLAKHWQLEGASAVPLRVAPLDLDRLIAQVAQRVVAREVAEHAERVVAREDIYDDLILSFIANEWRDQFQGEIDALIATIKIAIFNGIEQGEGMSEIMRRVAQAIGISIDRRIPTNRANYSKVQALTQTVVARAANDAALNLYRQTGVKRYQILTARDERVCAICAPLDGQVIEMDNPTLSPPFHARCRCSHIPIVERPAEEAKAPASFSKWAKNLGYNVIAFLKRLGVRL